MTSTTGSAGQINPVHQEKGGLAKAEHIDS